VLWEIVGRMSGLPGGGGQRPAAQVVARSRQYLEAAYTKFIRYQCCGENLDGLLLICEFIRQ